MAMSLPRRPAAISPPQREALQPKEAGEKRSIWQAVAAKVPACEVRTEETQTRDEELHALNLRGFLWTLFFFKIGTIAVIFWAAGGSSEATMLISATTWPWLIIPAIVVFGWLLFHFRMRRARARRAMLVRSEWMLEERATMETVRAGIDREGVDGWSNM